MNITVYPKLINFYKIFHPDEPTFVYIGSTCKTIVERFEEHKADLLISGRKCTSALVLERYPDAEIVLLDTRICESPEEKAQTEGQIIKAFRTAVNKHLCGRTSKQYVRDNRERISKMAAQRVVCECGAQISQGQLAKHLKTKKHLMG